MMDRFERRLKSLPLAKPSDGLRERIFGKSERQRSTTKRVWLWRPVPRVVFRRRIGLGWAALFALMTGLAGFVFGNRSEGVPGVMPLQSSIEVRIVEAASDRPNFDLTTSPMDFLSGAVRVEIETQQEI